MNSRLLLPLIGAATVAGCASAPIVEAQLSGVLPDQSATYQLLETETATLADRAAVDAVRAALAGRGWIEAKDDAVWRIETAYAVRPQNTGIFTDADARRGKWTDAPRTPQWWSSGRQTYTLTIILIEPGSQVPAYHASAMTVLGARQSDSAPGLLATAAVSQLHAGQ